MISEKKEKKCLPLPCPSTRQRSKILVAVTFSVFLKEVYDHLEMVQRPSTSGRSPGRQAANFGIDT